MKTTIKSEHTHIHNVQACVLGCQDPRFQSARAEYLKSQYNLTPGTYDPLVAPGAGKAIMDGRGDILLFGIEVAVGLHSGEIIYIFHHTDCGAYGGSKNFDSTEAEAAYQYVQLGEIKTKIQDHLRSKFAKDVDVVTILEHLGDGEVMFEVVV